MIRNERQYRVTLAERDRLTAHLNAIQPDNADPHTADGPHETAESITSTDWVREATQRAISAQLMELDESLADYETLQAGQAAPSAPVSNLADLPRALIRARIAAGLTQRDLASRLGLREQQIQRYEADDYAGANIARLNAVMHALDVDLDATVSLTTEKGAASALTRTLRGLGISSKVLTKRFLSPANDNPVDLLGAASRAARIFDTSPEALLAGQVPQLANQGAFRAMTSANRDKLNGYARYAEYLAFTLQKACTRPYRPLPDLPQLRKLLDTTTATSALESLLDVCWDHGIPVLPLADEGAFYGACWTFPDGPVIALKNNVRTPERWVFLLGHELDHAAHPEEPAVLEEGFEVNEWRAQPAEVRADNFATQLLLGEQAEAMTRVAVRTAGNDVARLKSVIPDVAEAVEVAPGLLADHIAFRVAQSGIDWWPTARRLHTLDADAWRITRSALFSHADLSRLDELDREILVDGIAP